MFVHFSINLVKVREFWFRIKWKWPIFWNGENGYSLKWWATICAKKSTCGAPTHKTFKQKFEQWCLHARERLRSREYELYTAAASQQQYLIKIWCRSKAAERLNIEGHSISIAKTIPSFLSLLGIQSTRSIKLKVLSSSQSPCFLFHFLRSIGSVASQYC